MKFINKIFVSAALLGSAVMLPACSDDVNLDNAKAVFVEITPQNMTLTVGQTQRLSATVQNEDGKALDVPVTWTIDDETVAKIVPVYRKEMIDNPNYVAPTEPAEGEEPGEGEEAAEEPGEGEGEGEVTPAEPEKIEIVTDEFLYYQVEAQPGAQNRSTVVRATLPNGDYALATVNVVNLTMTDDCLKAYSPSISASYMNTATAYFTLDPIEIFDEQPVTAEFKITEYLESTYEGTGEPEVSFRGRDDIRVIHDEKAGDLIAVDFIPPTLCGKGVVTLIIGEGATAKKASVPFNVLPNRFPGFEVDGKRPLAAVMTPSNVKQTLLYATMDVNSDYAVGACIGVETHSPAEIARAMACEDGEEGKEPYFYWEVEGSAVVVTDQWIDTNYEGGYVSYCKVHSGTREGLSILRYVMPDTVMTCNLTVENYNVSRPVDRIVVRRSGEETNNVTIKMGAASSIEVAVEPEASYPYHIPEVVSLDPNIVKVEPRGAEAGYTRDLTPMSVGATKLRITSLDKEIYVDVTVLDAVRRFQWPNGVPTEMTVGNTANVAVDAAMESGNALPAAITFTSSDPSVLSIENVPGSLNEAKLTAHAAGTVTISATLLDQTITREITVNAVQDINVDEDIYMENNGDGTFTFGPDSYKFFISNLPFVTDGNFAGTYNVSNIAVELDGVEYEGSSLSLTITYVDEDEDESVINFTINGTITVANGCHIIFNGVRGYTWME